MTSGEDSEGAQSEMISVVLLAPRDGQALLAEVQRVHGVLQGMAHEFLVICDAPALALIEAMPALPPAMRVVEQTDHDAGGYAEGFRAAAGDVVVTLNGDGGDDVAMIPMMVSMVREEGCAVVACRGRRRGVADWGLFVLAGMDAGNVESQFRAYQPAFIDWQRVESVRPETVGIELAVKANLQECGLGEVRAGVLSGGSRGSLRGCWRWVGLALQGPLLVWAVWWAMISVALLQVSYRSGGMTRGDFANVALLAAAAFAFTIAARRVRHRMRVADAFFSLVLLNPLLYAKAQPFDRTLMSTGLLGLMAGAIIAMNRNNVARYFAVMALALLLTWLSPDFLILLPALALWIMAAGYLMAVSRAAGSRARGFVVMAIGEIGLFVFGLACIFEKAQPTPPAEKLFEQIVGLVDFPLIVLGIVAVGLGWRKGPRGTTPPHFAGVLALLVGLLTMLLNNFSAGELSRPGADQTVLLICMLYVVFALHGPRALRWVIPPALLLAAAAYTVFR